MIRKFEQIIFYILSAIIMLYIAIEIIELVYQFGKALITSDPDSDRLLVSKHQTGLVLPVFFNILIAIELFDTCKIM
jgi:uncharacterized membrane protein (DUF373 family)